MFGLLANIFKLLVNIIEDAKASLKSQKVGAAGKSYSNAIESANVSCNFSRSGITELVTGISDASLMSDTVKSKSSSEEHAVETNFQGILIEPPFITEEILHKEDASDYNTVPWLVKVSSSLTKNANDSLSKGNNTEKAKTNSGEKAILQSFLDYYEDDVQTVSEASLQSLLSKEDKQIHSFQKNISIPFKEISSSKDLSIKANEEKSMSESKELSSSITSSDVASRDYASSKVWDDFIQKSLTPVLDKDLMNYVTYNESFDWKEKI